MRLKVAHPAEGERAQRPGTGSGWERAASMAPDGYQGWFHTPTAGTGECLRLQGRADPRESWGRPLTSPRGGWGNQEGVFPVVAWSGQRPFPRGLHSYLQGAATPQQACTTEFFSSRPMLALQPALSWQ